MSSWDGGWPPRPALSTTLSHEGLDGLQNPLWPVNGSTSSSSFHSALSVTSMESWPSLGPLVTHEGPLVMGSSRPSSPFCPHWLSLPEEIHIKVLDLLDPSDLLAYARTCQTARKYVDSQQVWKHQWVKLSRKTPFTFLSSLSLVDLGVNFKDSCRRLWKIMVTEGEIGGLNLIKCVFCKEYTCLPSCIEDRVAKVAIDIGGKITWLITPSYSIKRHLSMIAVPKFLKCYDCDATLNRSDLQSDLVMPSPPEYAYHTHPEQMHEVYCRSRHMASHTALEYCSQPLSEIWLQPPLSRPFCLFCEDQKVNWMICEREIVSNTKNKMKSVRPPYMSGEEEFLNYAAVSPLTNGYCRDTGFILGTNNLDLLSPLIALEHDDAFPVVRAFLIHLFKHYKIINDLQRPYVSLVFTHANIPHTVKEKLIQFLFEEMKISRLCLLPKALAISQLFEIKTCVVVDSGATSTFVWVVLDGKVDENRTQTMSVGGWHVSQCLKQAMAWQEGKDTSGATISSLDTSAVKQKCRLTLNLSREGDHRSGPSRSETLHIKSQNDAQRKLEMTEVTFSSELYLAPEMMYASLDLPSMVREAVKELPDCVLKDCFSHILITGGNTELRGFSQRLSNDLRELMPSHAPIINVCRFPNGNHSWNTVMGAYSVKVPPPYENILQLHEPGTSLWMSREEYVMFGSHQLAGEATN
ncbi:hypothetical protein TCAL_07407 [Tigriopus californicus]|uniref:F-box domain-containing protein n=1 Tax=Tigriopus californicus TaxID=6832 RepID=A0A553PIH1_TIGCA|nr:uncharacterized protein LOC131881414 [Tigriopus californicus]TRY77482.1 hypothetical protein TCAL_07407 [Tigriopus californicus]|eukprot:TCALIF_07407-PA protein Name:"Similar to arp6 Actin-like protein arp6 (Schizosaccharomyces pombe (strain 972 / ATCC 24843))" AED:0.03 eAED:0.03 QI:526/1/1/1/0.83/0.71/7/38/692